MKFRTSVHRTHTLTLDDDVDDIELQLQFPPADWCPDPLVERVGNKIVVGYLTRDDDCEDPIESCDGMGKIIGRGRYETRRHDESELFEALALTRDGDRNYDLVSDDVNQAWKNYLGSKDRDFWSTVIDALGYPVPSRDDDAAMDAAGNYINALRDELSKVDIVHEGSTYYAIWEADRYVTQFNAERQNMGAAADLFEFDVEKEMDAAWVDAVTQGRIGNPHAVMLDVYDHSGLHWSISGGGMRCQWDTSVGAGVWLPDTCGLDEIKRRGRVYAQVHIRPTHGLVRGKTHQVIVDGNSVELTSDWGTAWDKAKVLAALQPEPTPEQLRTGEQRAAEELAQEALDQYNAWLSGDCYGCCIETFYRNDDGTWDQIAEDACWGFVGSEWAEQELREQFFDQAVADLKAEEATV